MVIPVGDAPNARGAAPVTHALIALNVAIFVLVSLPLSARRPDPRDPELREYVEVMSHATRGELSPAELLQQTSSYDLYVFTHGYRPAEPSLADLLYCMFLHGGFLHLAGNMLFLWIYGDNVEKHLGSLRFLFWYLATGVAATLFHSFFASTSEVPLVGASGAISGVLGFYFVWFPRNIVRLLFLIPPFLMQVFEVPARLVLGIYLFMDNLLPYILSRGEGGVAHGAHIGGFVAGLAVAWIHTQRVQRKEPVLRGAPEPEPPHLHEAIRDGRLGEAADTYLALPLPRRAKPSPPRKRSSSRAGSAGRAAPATPSCCCGARCATCTTAPGSPKRMRWPDSSCWRTGATPLPPTSTC